MKKKWTHPKKNEKITNKKKTKIREKTSNIDTGFLIFLRNIILTILATFVIMTFSIILRWTTLISHSNFWVTFSYFQKPPIQFCPNSEVNWVPFLRQNVLVCGCWFCPASESKKIFGLSKITGLPLIPCHNNIK